MDERLVPDPLVPGAFRVAFGQTAQSWVDPARPDYLAFEYTQQIGAILEELILSRPAEPRLRIIHVGGGGLSLPRWIEHHRPHTAQIVLEPDSDLVAEVRRKLPLPRQSGIKIREKDGRSGIADMPEQYADAIIVDAFADATVPGELATGDWFAELARVLRPNGSIIMNLTDVAPFEWARRCVAGIAQATRHTLVGAEPSVLNGRRFGNLVAVGSLGRLPVRELERRCRTTAFPYRLVRPTELTKWLGGATPFQQPQPSFKPIGRHFWFA